MWVILRLGSWATLGANPPRNKTAPPLSVYGSFFLRNSADQARAPFVAALRGSNRVSRSLSKSNDSEKSP